MTKRAHRATNAGKPLSRQQAAVRLNIAVDDLPDQNWTRTRVEQVRSDQPEWLTRARRKFAKTQEAKARQQREDAVQAEIDRLERLLRDWGYSEQDPYRKAEEAATRLIPFMEVGDYIEEAADRIWPGWVERLYGEDDDEYPLGD